MPALIHVVHAVARPAYQGVARGVIRGDHDGNGEGTDDNAGSKELSWWEGNHVFPVHFLSPRDRLTSLEGNAPIMKLSKGDMEKSQ